MKNPEWEAKYQKMIYYHSTDGIKLRKAIIFNTKKALKILGEASVEYIEWLCYAFLWVVGATFYSIGYVAFAIFPMAMLDEDPNTRELRRIADRLDEMDR